MQVKIQGREFELLPDRALFWPAQSLLCISDLHLGKAESLQSFGLPIPSGDALRDLNRVALLLKQTQAKKLFILGDLVHQKRGFTDDIVEGLRKFLEFFSGIEVTLILGNHERGVEKILRDLPWEVTDADLWVEGVRFTHGHSELEPGSESEIMVQGHLHPVTTMKQGSTQVRLPCFWLAQKTLTLPSFGGLTGGHEIKPEADDQIFVTTGEDIVPVKKRAGRKTPTA